MSEVLIIAGGFQAGRPWAAAVTALLLALGFLGLAHALIETTTGKAPRRDAAPHRACAAVSARRCVGRAARSRSPLRRSGSPGSDIVQRSARGIS